MAMLIKNNRILLNDNIFPHEEASMEVLLAKKRILKLIQAWEENQIESWSLPALLLQFLNDSRTINEMLKKREQAANLAVQQEQEEQAAQKNSSIAITTVLSTEEPEYSLSMRDEHLSTIPKTKSEEVIKFSVKNLVPIPIEYEVTFDDESECDVPIKDESSPVFTTFSNTIFDDNDDFTSSDDGSLSDEDVSKKNFKSHSNPLFDDEEIISSKIDPHHFAESDLIESLLNRDTLFDSSLKFDYLEEFSGELMPTSIIDKEIDIFIGTDDLMPPCIESDGYDSGGDIHIFEELLSNDTSLIPENKSSNLDHHDDPSFPHPPLEPPDVEIFFEPNSVDDTLLPFSSENEDKVFKPDILSYLLVSHRDKTTFDFFENPMMIYGGDIPLLWRLDKWEHETWYCGSRLENGSVLGTVAAGQKKVQYEVRESSILEADVAQGDWWIRNLQLPMMRYEE
nr:hypothetical protein [Tanacetum cinerariifolium]